MKKINYKNKLVFTKINNSQKLFKLVKFSKKQ